MLSNKREGDGIARGARIGSVRLDVLPAHDAVAYAVEVGAGGVMRDKKGVVVHTPEPRNLIPVAQYQPHKAHNSRRGDKLLAAPPGLSRHRNRTPVPEQPSTPRRKVKAGARRRHCRASRQTKKSVLVQVSSRVLREQIDAREYLATARAGASI